MDTTGQGEIFKVVRPFDPAIRWSQAPADGAADVIAYMTRRELGPVLECVIDGKRPVVFHTRRLRRAEMRDVEGLPTEQAKHEAAFACGVVMVETDHGEVLRPARERWTAEELDRHFHFADVEDIGSVIVTRSRIPFGLSVSYAAPRSSAAASGALLFPSAARSPAAAPPSSSAPAGP